MRTPLVALCASIVLCGHSARADGVFLTPPVDATVVSSFDAPPHPYGPGHRGVDFAVPAGSPVRAAAPGRVTFAGMVALRWTVTIDHGSLSTTYSWLSDVYVDRGDYVEEGRWIGTSGDAHGPQTPGLHLGVKIGDRYVDPMRYLGPIDASQAIALAPLDETWPFEKDHVRSCKPAGRLPLHAPRPNDNIAVAIGGITSATDGSGAPPDLFAAVGRLGYSPGDSYEFSYRGAAGPGFHVPYGRADTYIDVRAASERLRHLMLRIAKTHPGKRVDLLAHSQGGVVARTYLAEQARNWDTSLPRVEHLVTFASPHRGVPIAGEVDELRSGPLLSRAGAAGLEFVSENTSLPVPPPDGASVRQLQTGSELLTALEGQDVSYGTRVLALSIPNDIIVPADQARYPGKPSRTIPREGLFGHSAIVGSPAALGLAHGFLSGAGPGCPPELSLLDRKMGWMTTTGQRLVGEVTNLLTRAITPFG